MSCFSASVFSRIETIKKNGATILFVSHSGGAVVELCDHAVLIDSGEKLMIGAPKIIIGKYQKLIYAPQDKHHTIREEIRASGGDWQVSEPPHASRAAAQSTIENKHAIDNAPEEFFDPNLKPQNTLKFESQGAHIDSPQILTLSGERVNCLQRGKSYRYTYKVSFDKGATNVRFSMLIKTTSGLELGGAASAPSVGQGIPYLAPGTIIKVEFRFNCNLNPGVYFLNAGVTEVNRGEKTVLHRVLDLCVIKVMPITDDTATATIDFNCVAEIELLKNPS